MFHFKTLNIKKLVLDANLTLIANYRKGLDGYLCKFRDK